MNKGVLLQVIVILITLIIVGFISLFILNNMNDRILTACESINYEGIYSFNDVDVNCTQLWETNFSNNKWSNKCSLLPFSKKISCRTYCVIDCYKINQKEGKYTCVC